MALASIAIVTSTRAAHALGPVGVEIGAKAGVGTNPFGADSSNPLGPGLGGRAGVILFDHLYGGVDLMYYPGAGGGANDEPVLQGNVSTLMYGIEAGWGFTLIDILTIRPQVGLGNASFNVSDFSGSTYWNLYVEPGVTGVLSLGTPFIGADANALVFPGLSIGGVSVSHPAFTIHAQVGVKF